MKRKFGSLGGRAAVGYLGAGGYPVLFDPDVWHIVVERPPEFGRVKCIN